MIAIDSQHSKMYTEHTPDRSFRPNLFYSFDYVYIIWCDNGKVLCAPQSNVNVLRSTSKWYYQLTTTTIAMIKTYYLNALWSILELDLFEWLIICISLNIIFMFSLNGCHFFSFNFYTLALLCGSSFCLPFMP